VPVTAHDEIGELAEAFNRVQTTAGALLERQVLSRRNTAEMFGNVGRRVSNLTTRQLALIDAVERSETDPALLERLYSIDHIAVRLRRNADSLMLLAGIRETVLDAEPAALSNVVRAALGQIEGYQRVRLYAASDAVVAPDIIGDLTLMLAELLENAVTFSPAGSPVEVTVRAADEGVHVVITDHGLGMSPDRLAEENARMVRRERLDLAPTKVLGLFVVGALARRWSIAVTLTRTPGGGVTAEVTLPASLLLTMSPPSGQGEADAAGPDRGTPGQPVPGRAAGAPIRTVPADAAARGGPAPAPKTQGEDAPVPGTSPSKDSGRPAPPAADAPLPRRIPRREPAPEGERAADGVPSDTPDTHASERAAGSAARPLRRRVRGATLHTTAGAARAVPEAVRIRDAEAERAALEEFEAAVARALHDTGNHPRPPEAPAAADAAPPPQGAPEPGNTPDQAPSPKEPRVEHVDR
jgi:anti-sigma regulatory factor (Ser/Thr protein kinase)